ncbi:MAG: hypothetical protein R2734_19625 [Nocardioides sp.]
MAAPASSPSPPPVAPGTVETITALVAEVRAMRPDLRIEAVFLSALSAF